MRSKLVLLFAAGSFMAFAADVVAHPAIVTELVNLRSGPGLNFAPILAIPAHTLVDVGTCRASWCRVAHAGANGYVAAAAVSLVTPRSPDAPRLPPVGAHVWTRDEPPLFDPYDSGGPWYTGPWRYENSGALQWRYGFPGGLVPWHKGLGWRPGFGFFF